MSKGLRIQLILSAIFLITISSSAAYAIEMEIGACDFDKETVSSVNCIGPATLAKTTSTGGVSVSGPIKADQSTMGQLHAVGMAEITNSTVKGNANIAGPIKADSVTFNGSLSVAGVADLIRTTIEENTKVTGFLSATFSTFDGDLLVAYDHAILKSSTVKGSVTLKSDGKKPILELTCGSKVQGSITFEGMPGVVKQGPNSVIVSGDVVNGTVETVTTKESC